MSSKSQIISESDVQVVVETLRSDYLTTGPKVAQFEQAFAEFTGARNAVAVCNGTAALHAAMHSLDIQPGDEVIVPAITFAATANAVVYQGGTPVFADVEPDTLLISAESVAERITPQTRAIITVDYAGQPCDYQRLQTLANQHSLTLVADACHAVGGAYRGRPVGSLARLSTFSFHPVKNMTTGEGGAITTDDDERAQRMRRFRNHGINADHHTREASHTWFYEQVDLGYNYRITDFQCALGVSQLRRLPRWITRRRQIAGVYDAALSESDLVQPLAVRRDVGHAYHLYVVRLATEKLSLSRDEIFRQLREAGVGVNVHYIPVHLHPFYRRRFNTTAGLCPVAEQAYEEILSLPINANMTTRQAKSITQTLLNILETARF